MKVSSIVELARNQDLPPLQRNVLNYLDAHSDEVFRYRDAKLAKDLDAKWSALGFTLWALSKKGLIGRERVASKVYFGSKAAIEELREKLGIQADDPLERARRNRERIFARVGNIDTRRLLDDVREGRWE